jgi:hypothetical protein
MNQSSPRSVFLTTLILLAGVNLPWTYAADPTTPVAQPSGSSTAVNLAPPFSGGANAGKNISLNSLRGKPVILVIAPSPRDHAFRKQMKELRGHYERLAAQGMIGFVAFTSEGGRIPSNIPFILVNDPAGTSAAYDVEKGFAIAVIGRDGNLDCLSVKPLPGYRINDLVINNAGMQTLLRR